MTAWSIVLHGGASAVTSERQAAVLRGCNLAIEEGARLFARKGDPVEAAVAVVRALERDTVFNAGRGAVRGANGQRETDAAVMDGTTLDIGAVAAVPECTAPVALAHALLRRETIMVAGPSATALASSASCPPAAGTSQGASGACDTVGCVAWRGGRVAVATATGGLQGKPPGRVGDAPLPGCGFYADSRYGGVVISGDGERIARVLLAARVMELLRCACGPMAAAEGGLECLAAVGGEAGVVVLDSVGKLGCAYNSAHFPVAFANSQGSRWISLTPKHAR
jgi:L-asparaginase / beta-aspartyl-peptidase